MPAYPRTGPWATGGLPHLNIASVCPGTQVLGPGWRAAVWVQGCPHHCPGCIAPNWIPMETAHHISPVDLAACLLQDAAVTGLTFSGGEPMLQAAGLAETARLVRQQRDVSVICYTGFTLEYLLTHPIYPGVNDLLEQCDVLIDGLYVAAWNDNRGLRGSANQRVHHLTDRLAGYDFIGQPRKAEIVFDGDQAFLVGVPTQAVARSLDTAANWPGFAVPNEQAAAGIGASK